MYKRFINCERRKDSRFDFHNYRQLLLVSCSFPVSCEVALDVESSSTAARVLFLLTEVRSPHVAVGCLERLVILEAVLTHVLCLAVDRVRLDCALKQKNKEH